jgi:hypothetical protein
VKYFTLLTPSNKRTRKKKKKQAGRCGLFYFIPLKLTLVIYGSSCPAGDDFMGREWDEEEIRGGGGHSWFKTIDGCFYWVYYSVL